MILLETVRNEQFTNINRTLGRHSVLSVYSVTEEMYLKLRLPFRTKDFELALKYVQTPNDFTVLIEPDKWDEQSWIYFEHFEKYKKYFSRFRLVFLGEEEKLNRFYKNQNGLVKLYRRRRKPCTLLS